MWLCGAAAIAVPMLGNVASAQTVINFNTNGLDQFAVNLPSSGVNNETAYVGGFSGTTTLYDVAGDLWWCDNVPNVLKSGDTFSMSVIGNGFQANGSSIVLGHAGDATAAQLNALIYNGQNYLAANNTKDVSAALQVAIWALLYNATSSWSSVTSSSNPLFVSGSDSTVTTDALDFLTCIMGGSATGVCSNWTANPYAVLANYVDGNSQGQSVIRMQVAIPEPSSLALLGAGLVGLAGVSRVRRRGGETDQASSAADAENATAS
jgi:hypothetical protein